MSNTSQNLFERLSTRHCWNNTKIPEYDIIEWIKTLTPNELIKQIECTKARNNNIIIAVETLSFDVAEYIYNFNKSYATPNIFWYIMIYSYNQNIEEKNPELFIKLFLSFMPFLSIAIMAKESCYHDNSNISSSKIYNLTSIY